MHIPRLFPDSAILTLELTRVFIIKGQYCTVTYKSCVIIFCFFALQLTDGKEIQKCINEATSRIALGIMYRYM